MAAGFACSISFISCLSVVHDFDFRFRIWWDLGGMPACILRGVLGFMREACDLLQVIDSFPRVCRWAMHT
jgi:hypothetical protein